MAPSRMLPFSTNATSRNRPHGLAGFLGRISGDTLLRDRLDRHHDSQRLKGFKEQKRQLNTVQRQEREALRLQQRLQAREIERQMKALDSIDKREIAALALDEQRDRYVFERSSKDGMSSLLSLLERPADRAPDLQREFRVPHSASRRHRRKARTLMNTPALNLTSSIAGLATDLRCVIHGRRKTSSGARKTRKSVTETFN